MREKLCFIPILAMMKSRKCSPGGAQRRTRRAHDCGRFKTGLCATSLLFGLLTRNKHEHDKIMYHLFEIYLFLMTLLVVTRIAGTIADSSARRRVVGNELNRATVDARAISTRTRRAHAKG